MSSALSVVIDYIADLDCMSVQVGNTPGHAIIMPGEPWPEPVSGTYHDRPCFVISFPSHPTARTAEWSLQLFDFSVIKNHLDATKLGLLFGLDITRSITDLPWLYGMPAVRLLSTPTPTLVQLTLRQYLIHAYAGKNLLLPLMTILRV